MPNSFALQPDISPVILPVTWTCPVSGVVIPKGVEENLIWRLSVLEDAENDPELQRDLYTAASKSVLFFVNAFCWTFRIFEVKGDSAKQAIANDIPFITWPIQDEHIVAVKEHITNGRELLTDKSRDLGGTWDHIVVLVHEFLFQKNSNGIMISRTEDAVDQLDGEASNYPNGSIADPGTLFGKIDYVLSRLPKWMLPAMGRKKFHLTNESNKARIDGESSSGSAAVSDRRRWIFIDEMALIKEGDSIKTRTRSVSACRLVCSTPYGPHTAYTKWRLSGSIDVFEMPWWKHPEKSQGIYTAQDGTGKWRIRSPWYDAECKSLSPREMATVHDMDHLGSGDLFFESHIIEQHTKDFAKPANFTRAISFPTSLSDDDICKAVIRGDVSKVKAMPGKTAAFRFWINLIDGRPNQTQTYTFGIDISKGQGASNSVCSVRCEETKEKVAEFADANIPPYEFAKSIVAAAVWFGGRGKRPKIVWENNGDPGMDFGRVLVRTYQYPNIYFTKQTGTLAEKRGKRYGWRSNTEAKANALGLLRRSYACGDFINHSREALIEALSYVYYENGGVGPAALSHETPSARLTHGDRVIADMLTLVGSADTTLAKKAEIKIPEETMGYRWKKAKEELIASRKGGRFDFRNSNLTAASDV